MPSADLSEERTKFVLGRITARRGRISFTYVLTLLENAFELMYPWAIGIAINGVLAGQRALVLPLIGIWIAHIVVGGIRQLYDTRLFSRLYADIAADIVRLQLETGVEVSEISARVEMAEEFTDFFETEMPVIFEVFISLFGSIALLLLFDFRAGLIMASLILPVAIINTIMARRALKVNSALNSQWETQINIIEDGRARPARVHFGRLAQWRIRLSDLDAASWTLTEVFTLTATILVLLHVASTPDVLAGDIFATLAYVFRIEKSVDQIPALVQQCARLVDIRTRIRAL